MLKLPIGLSFDFLGTLARFRDGASVGTIYQDFTKFLSPVNERSTPLTEAMAQAIRSLPASTIDETFRDSFKEAAKECLSNKRDGLKLHVPHEDKFINIRLPGGTTHEETEEFWLHVVRNTYQRAIQLEANKSLLGGAGGDHFHHPAELAKTVMENDCFVEDFFYPLYEHLGSAAAYECPPLVTDALDWLKSLRCCEDGHEMKFVMVSNYDGRLHDIVRGLNLDKYFDEVLSIHETKCLKPDAAGLKMGIFERGIFDVVSSPSLSASNQHLEIFRDKYITEFARIKATKNNRTAALSRADENRALLRDLTRHTSAENTHVTQSIVSSSSSSSSVASTTTPEHNKMSNTANNNNNNNNKNNKTQTDHHLALLTTPKFWVHVGDSKADEEAASKVPCLFCPVNPPLGSHSHSPLSDPVFPKDDSDDGSGPEPEYIKREMIDMTLMKNFMISHYGTQEYVSRLLNAGEYVRALPDVVHKLEDTRKND